MKLENNMKEEGFQREFGKNNLLYGVFELKLCKGKSIRFDAVKKHQREALLAVNSSKGLYHKIADPPVFRGMHTRFNAKRPFDCFFIRKQDAYVVVMFYTPRQKKNVYYIRIEDWMRAEDLSPKKSITEKEIKNISSWVIDYAKTH